MSTFEERQKKFYKSLQPCFCPSIQETVHFNAEGLRHLLYKRNRPRSKKEQHYRLGLLRHVPHALKTATKAHLTTHTHPQCELWTLEWVEVRDKIFTKMKIKVVVRRIGNGNVHFLSVMRKKHNGQRHMKKSR